MSDEKSTPEDERDTGLTLIGFGVALGVPTAIMWALGVDEAAPFVGLSILFLIGGFGHRASA